MFTKTINEVYKMLGGDLSLNGHSASEYICGVCFDSRKIEKDNLYFAFPGDRVDGHTFINDVSEKGACLAIISKDEYREGNLATLLVDDVTVAFQRLASMYRDELETTLIGITGSNGKTSAKDLLASVLSIKGKTSKTLGNYNNEIGVPYTLLNLDADDVYGVIEMGMENFEDIHFLNTMVKQDAAVITNVGVAHLANLGSLDNIGRAKFEIIDDLKPNSLFIYYGDDVILDKIKKEKKLQDLHVQTFGDEKSNTIYLKYFVQEIDCIKFQTNLSKTIFSIKTLGRHQALNAMIAILYAYSIGLNDDEIQLGFDAYEATRMRNEVLQINNTVILNDAYKSNPQSALAAIDTFSNIDEPYKIIVLADMLDLGDDEKQYHYDLGVALKDYEYDELITYGELSKNIEDGAMSLKPNKKYRHMKSHEEVINYLRTTLNRKQAILFKGSRGMALDKVVDALKGDSNGKD